MCEHYCGTCKYHRIDDEGEWICVNNVSDNYTDYTDFNDYCIDYEERE